ncbi:MAG: CocE/NonD family hydrolase, partial [Bacteroidia bacterium]|nr:CocE/NonD family hydrolase [Bacteroidia bacterium]
MKNYFFSLVALLITTATSAQLSPDSRDIPMRDGKYLAADFYSNDSTVQKPTILIMTPYGKFFYTIIGLPFDIGYDFSKSNYNFVIVDWRGRFASSGAFAIDSDNGEDGYDVVEWIAAQSWSDGKIGTWGPSALGGVQFDLAKEKPPHLTCCVPEVAAPIYEYSHYHPGGVLETATYRT